MSRPFGFKHTEETKKKMSNLLKGRVVGGRRYKGWKQSDEAKKRMSISSQKRWSKKDEHDKVSGNKSKFWKGGVYKGKSGYVLKESKYEHRLVMEKSIGRKLTSIEVVHHIDKNRSNNKIENLMLFPNQSEHLKYHKKHD